MFADHPPVYSTDTTLIRNWSWSMPGSPPYQAASSHAIRSIFINCSVGSGANCEIDSARGSFWRRLLPSSVNATRTLNIHTIRPIILSIQLPNVEYAVSDVHFESSAHLPIPAAGARLSFLATVYLRHSIPTGRHRRPFAERNSNHQGLIALQAALIRAAS